MFSSLPEMRTVNAHDHQIVYTNKARCRDCYRCVRACPVKAIRMEDAQAQVEADRCIVCGTCIRECPQEAKTFRRDLDGVRDLLAQNRQVAISVAPSFAAIFDDWGCARLPSALRRLGFRVVAETAVGAWHVARETAAYLDAHPGRVHIATACPAVVRFVERYRPNRLRDLIPIPSPMIMHARMLRQRYGAGVKVVFVGPCVAKKDEAERREYAGCVDAVIGFPELLDWLAAEGIDLASCEESAFDDIPGGAARLFPLAGGSLRTADMSTDLLDEQILTVTGADEIIHALDACDLGPVRLIEPLFCPGGCIGGPIIGTERSVYHRRANILEYGREHPGEAMPSSQSCMDTLPRFSNDTPRGLADITEDAIRAVLKRTGKAQPEHQLNCGSCGYPSCRDQAIAVLSHMAEPEMCIPYMRRLAEQRSDRIQETSPNGIIILDRNLRILSMNPAFRKLFMCSDALLGEPVSRLMDPDPFDRIIAGESPLIDRIMRHERYGIVCHEKVYMLAEEGQVAAIFVDITDRQDNRRKLDELRAETVCKAEELLAHQIRIAQEITKFLGENTARGEALVERLVELSGEKRDTDISGGSFPWNDSTSKRI